MNRENKTNSAARLSLRERVRARRRRTMEGIIFFALVMLDQLVKLAVKVFMYPGESIPILPQIFHLTYVLNPGAAFGILENQRLFFILAGGVVLLAALYFLPKIRQESAVMHYGCAALLAGAVGNLIDRVYNGLVVDFLDFRFWPVFNIADIAIVLGVGCMMYALMFPHRIKETP